jgi:uncharacterized delta-60 repeat protein
MTAKARAQRRRAQHECKPRLEVLESRDLLSAGALDPTFGNGGVFTPPANPYEGWSVLAVQGDGKLVEAGAARWGGIQVLRQNPDGSPDAFFGAGGRVVTDAKPVDSGPVGSFDPVAVAVQPDGKIVVAASEVYRTTEDGPSLHPQPPGTAVPLFLVVTQYRRFALFRYNGDGSLDSSFGQDGKVVTALSNGDDAPTAVAVQGDGKIVVAGKSDNEAALVRYNGDGSLDPTFGQGGVELTPLGARLGIGALAIDGSGDIVAAGSLSDASGMSALTAVRYRSDGSLDPTFGDGGIAVMEIGDRGSGASSVAVAADGSLVVAGRAWFALTPTLSKAEFTLARFLLDGRPDAAFGDGGQVVTDLQAASDGSGKAVLESDGKIVLAGTLEASDHLAVVLARYGADGGLDASFGDGGVVTTTLGRNTAGMSDLALQPDGRIVVAGWLPGDILLTLAGFENDVGAPGLPSPGASPGRSSSPASGAPLPSSPSLPDPASPPPPAAADGAVSSPQAAKPTDGLAVLLLSPPTVPAAPEPTSLAPADPTTAPVAPVPGASAGAVFNSISLVGGSSVVAPSDAGDGLSTPISFPLPVGDGDAPPWLLDAAAVRLAQE